MVYRNKTYVCFDGDTDMHYYRLMQAWHQNDRSSFSFYDAHDLNTARDSSQEASIKRQLRDRLNQSKVLIVLIGERTRYLTKFVRWEMEQALSLHLPIIAVNVNGLRQRDDDRCPPIIRDELAIHISYNPAIMQFALENWPAEHDEMRRQGRGGPFYYVADVYRRLGL
ncbi:MAG: TIR domain-containing protein [Gemmatimonadaceae bacterium]